MSGNDSPLAQEDIANFLFLQHAEMLMKDVRKHGHWQLTEFETARFRLINTIRDRHRRRISLIIQATAGYPKRPPLVVTIPPHRDPCFQNGGRLDWTYEGQTGRYTWQLYAQHKNPLVYLLDELKTKYRLVF